MAPNQNPESDYWGTIEAAANETAEEYAVGEELYEYVFTDADAITAHEDADTLLGYLQASDTEPQEWKHMVEDDADYVQVLRAMAFECVRQDLYDALQERGVEP